MGEGAKDGATRPGFWPFRTLSEYRLTVERVGAVPFPEPLRAEETDALAHFVAEHHGNERRDVVGSLFVDLEGWVTGFTRGALAHCRGVRADPAALLVESFLAGGGAAVVFQYLPSRERPTPSTADLRLTKKLVLVGGIVDVPLLDHLVVVPGGEYLSLRTYRRGGWRWPSPDPAIADWPEESRWSGRTRPVKWRSPGRRRQGWAGTGTMPRWFVRGLAAGWAVEDVYVGDEELGPEELLREVAGQLVRGEGDGDGELPDSVDALREHVAELARRRLGGRKTSS